jgi:hypothetical protein
VRPSPFRESERERNKNAQGQEITIDGDTEMTGIVVSQLQYVACKKQTKRTLPTDPAILPIRTTHPIALPGEICPMM